ncbi:hypothetical protein [Lysobacter gummosus]|uniref:hypothetical protein n=1 Tax=Lysobacter gummosus TaxID=262324 RepID=UPI003630B92B
MGALASRGLAHPRTPGRPALAGSPTDRERSRLTSDGRVCPRKVCRDKALDPRLRGDDGRKIRSPIAPLPHSPRLQARPALAGSPTDRERCRLTSECHLTSVGRVCHRKARRDKALDPRLRGDDGRKVRSPTAPALPRPANTAAARPQRAPTSPRCFSNNGRNGTCQML